MAHCPIAGSGSFPVYDLSNGVFAQTELAADQAVATAFSYQREDFGGKAVVNITHHGLTSA